MQETIRILRKQYLPDGETIKVIKELAKREGHDGLLPYGVFCYLYGEIQGKREERIRRGGVR